MEQNLKYLVIYLRFLLKELISPLNYLIAFLIGITINYFQGLFVFGSFVPFVVPIVVQSISKASVKFSNRDMNLLVKLPMERKDPAFVMNYKGQIIAREGKTKDLFSKNKIETFFDVFEDHKVSAIKELISNTCRLNKQISDEWYSPCLRKWFAVHLKAEDYSNNVLVWLDDITLRKSLIYKLSKVRNFITQTMTSITEQVKLQDSYDRLARFVLESGYKGVFITSKDEKDNLKGNVYKLINKELVKSDEITIEKDSDAPVWDSRRESRLVSDTRANYRNPDVFDSKHKFDNKVLDFLDFRIDNFINYHENNISFIVFNKDNPISYFDHTLIEAVVSSAFTINYLVQKIHSNQS
jgi:hypothetical protein